MVACFNVLTVIVTKSRSLNFALWLVCLTDLVGSRTEIRRLINMVSFLVDLCTHDNSVCALFIILSYDEAQSTTLKANIIHNS